MDREFSGDRGHPPSVHVQYHTTLAPYTTAPVGLGTTTACSSGVIFIDYLILNNNYFGSPAYDDFAGYMPSTVKIWSNGSNHTWWNLIGSGANMGQSALYICYDSDKAVIYNIDRVFDQKQLDVNKTDASAGGSVGVGEFTDQDNVTASFGIFVDFRGTAAARPLIYKFVVP